MLHVEKKDSLVFWSSYLGIQHINIINTFKNKISNTHFVQNP